MINKLQLLKGKTKLKLHKKIGRFYIELKIRRKCYTFQFEEGPSCKEFQGFSKNYREVILLKKTLQTKPQFKSMNIVHYDLYCTSIKKGGDEEIVS